MLTKKPQNAQMWAALAADAQEIGAWGAGRSGVGRREEDGPDLQVHKAGEWLLADLAVRRPAQLASVEDLRLQECSVAGWLSAALAGCRPAQLVLAVDLRLQECLAAGWLPAELAGRRSAQLAVAGELGRLAC